VTGGKKMKAEKNNERGFSLMELMLTMMIAAILVAIAIGMETNARQQAMLAVLQSDINTMQQASARFAFDIGVLPPSVYRGTDPGLVTEYGWQGVGHSGDWESLDLSMWRGPYMDKWPLNPWGGLYEWDKFSASSLGDGVTKGGAYLVLQPSGFGGTDGMPGAAFENLVRQNGLDMSQTPGVFAFLIGTDSTTGN